MSQNIRGINDNLILQNLLFHGHVSEAKAE